MALNYLYRLQPLKIDGHVKRRLAESESTQLQCMLSCRYFCSYKCCWEGCQKSNWWSQLNWSSIKQSRVRQAVEKAFCLLLIDRQTYRKNKKYGKHWPQAKIANRLAEKLHEYYIYISEVYVWDMCEWANINQIGITKKELPANVRDFNTHNWPDSYYTYVECHVCYVLQFVSSWYTTKIYELINVAGASYKKGLQFK